MRYKKPKQSGKEIDKDNFKNARFLLEKIINNKQNVENKSSLKQFF